VPPFTKVEPLEFEDIKFHIEDFKGTACFRTGNTKAFLDELYYDDGSKHFVINDSNYLDKLVQKENPIQHNNHYLNQLDNEA
jgi:alpha-D-ribose 1-methylphosphonate 5-phosphate C-P lyase